MRACSNDNVSNLVINVLYTLLNTFFNFAFVDLVIGELKNLRDKTEVKKALKTAIMSKQYGNEDFLAKLIADACSECSVTLSWISISYLLMFL